MLKTTTNTKTRIIFFGSGQSSALILQDLLQEKDIAVVGVVSQSSKIHAHTHQRTTPVAQLAQVAKIPFFTPTKLTEITKQIRQLQPDVGVLFAYGKILPLETLDTFPHGIINIHPSLLPLHRGPSPLESTILAGDTTVGTSIMLITPEMDAGPILAQDSFTVPANIQKLELWEKLLKASRNLLVPTLRAYLSHTITPTPQDLSQKPSYSKLIKKQDGDISPKTMTAVQLERLVRAYSGWPGVRIPILLRNKPQTLSLHQVKIHDTSTNKIKLYCQNKHLLLQLSGGCIEILQAQLPGKRVVTGRDLCNVGEIRLA